jgi:hypothetical protein
MIRRPFHSVTGGVSRSPIETPGYVQQLDNCASDGLSIDWVEGWRFDKTPRVDDDHVARTVARSVALYLLLLLLQGTRLPSGALEWWPLARTGITRRSKSSQG